MRRRQLSSYVYLFRRPEQFMFKQRNYEFMFKQRNYERLLWVRLCRGISGGGINSQMLCYTVLGRKEKAKG